jgi:predicted nucleotidyltransferase
MRATAAVAIDESLIAEIVRRILTVTKPDKVILFGSAATDSMARDSDIDLLIIEANPCDVREESVRLYAALTCLGYPVDVMVMSTERFEETKQVIGGLAYPANKYGRVIYEAARGSAKGIRPAVA